jgi:predicted RNase H-like HicB family nuclease
MIMATIPQIEEKPTRFGGRSEVREGASWHEYLDANVYECRVLLCAEAEGGYSVHALRLPGVVSQGETLEEALDNIADAFRGAVSVYLEEDQTIPWTTVEIDRPAGSIERWILVNV